MAKERIGGLIAGSGTLRRESLPEKNFGLSETEANPSDLSVGRVDRCRRPDALWSEHSR